MLDMISWQDARIFNGSLTIQAYQVWRASCLPGAIAQMEEHLTGSQKAWGSSPHSSTIPVCRIHRKTSINVYRAVFLLHSRRESLLKMGTVAA